MLLRNWLGLLCAVVMVAGCGGDKATAPVPTVNGTWRGSFVSGTAGASVTLTLSQSGQQVSGNGAITVGTTDIAISTTGTFTNPNISLNVNATGYEPFTFVGSMSDASHISGALNGSGFTNVTLAIAKQ